MKGRRVLALVVISAITVGLVATLWGRLVSAQDSPAFQNSQPAQNFQNPSPSPDLGSNSGSPSNFDAAQGQNSAPPQDPGPQNPGAPGDPNGQSVPPPEANEPEVMTRGPMHEAFAQPVAFNPTPSPVIQQQPPKPVEEMPPEQKPEGAHVAWIPGYWSWEPEQKRFIWTSGIWRAIPNGVEWVPGYWAQVDGGAQWVSGFWRKENVTEVNYIPEQPPQALENGPIGNPPSADYVWVPGVWIWRPTGYAWRQGFWAPCNPDWIWCPAHYVWTPSGYVFIDGHWDYAIARRGVIFAPVVYRPGFMFRPGYVYTPVVAMDFGVCTSCLFCRPGFHCYCFGDYYAPNYIGVGVYPWFGFHGRYGYDPIFAYYNWHYGRNDPHWHERLSAEYAFRRDHLDARPARTYAAMRIGGGRGGLVLAVHINVLAGRGGGMRFERISAARRQELHQAAREIHAANERRAQIESRGAGRRGGPTKMTIPKSSLSASAHGGGTQGRATPQKSMSRTNQQNNRRPTNSRTPQRSSKKKPAEESRRE